MRELRPGLWHWEAPHPQWRATEPWSENVSSYAIDDGERLLLFDPLAVPGELVDLASGRETAIVLTAPWHERDAESLVEWLGVPVYIPLPDSAQVLMDSGRWKTSTPPANSRRATARSCSCIPAMGTCSVTTACPTTTKALRCYSSNAC